MTERAHAAALSAKVSSAMRNLTAAAKSRPLGEGGLPRSGKTEGGKTRTLFANLNCIFFAFYSDFQQFCGNVKNFADFA